MRNAVLTLCVAALATAAAAQPQTFDIIVRGGTVYDGSGNPGRRADVGIRGDRIAAVGDLASARAASSIDATNMAVAPGFINMLSWSTESLLVDGRSQGEIRQGVTTQIFGEGSSMGPLNDAMKRRMTEQMGDLKFDITWNTLAEYLADVERRGVSQNIASFLGATTVREYVVGLADRKPTAAELDEMRAIVRREMEAGALGIGSSLIYAPAFYATTEELIELCRVAAQYHGKYISHIRSEGNRLIESVEELIRIAREAKIPAEIYHLKAAGEANWAKMPRVIALVEDARRSGLRITADMYAYTAGATGLDASMPPWVLDGGYDEAYKRLRDPETRRKIAAAIRTPSREWENLYLAAGSPDRVLLVEFKSDALKPLTGKTLAEAAKSRGEDPVDTIMNLVLEDRSRVGTVYFMMSDANLTRQIKLPWVSFGSDAASMAPGTALHPLVGASPGLRQLRACARQVRPRREGADARRRRAPPQRTAGDQPRAPGSRLPPPGHVRRRGRLRSADDRRQGDVREAAPVRRGRSRRARQRHRRAAQRGTLECPARAGALRSGQGVAVESRWSVVRSP